MVQQTLIMSRWFPREGDLVAVPPMKKRKDGSQPKCSYGIIVQESKNSEFKGAWWDVLFEDLLLSLHVQCITPLLDKEGTWIKRGMNDTK